MFVRNQRVNQSKKKNMFIIDVQGFQYKTSPFICKEIAIINIENQDVHHRMFDCPMPLNLLEHGFQNQVDWTTKNVHGLSWDNNCSADVSNLSQESLCLYLKVIVQDSIIYVFGIQKKKWLEKFIVNTIVDLNELGCINLNKLKLIYTKLNKKNNYHCQKHIFNNLRCARENVFYLKRWFLHRVL